MQAYLEPKHRFVNGWDRAQDLENTLAGTGCSEHTFGHLGFTGTSIWIDPVKKLGHVILSNATKLYWYDKQDLNNFRRLIGQRIWQKDF
jgi:CubicO group peptidase (beta-lactamase class C family)